MSCNILYLTSRCNFDCEYCYEHGENGRAATTFDLTEQQAHRNIEEIIGREPDPNKQTMIVLFGGEPTLNWEVCKSAARYGYKLKKNIYFCLSTNGWRFRHDDFCWDYLKLTRDVGHQIGIDLSFDGVGNYRRKLIGGKGTTQGMFEVLRNMHRYNFVYSMRYTVHAGNIKLAARDLANIDKYFGPDKYVLSFDTAKLDLDELERTKAEIRQQYIDHNITRPVCNLVCDVCPNDCKRGGQYSYWSDNGNIRIVPEGELASEFKDF